MKTTFIFQNIPPINGYIRLPVNSKLNLFPTDHDPTINLLPYDGEVYYYGQIMDWQTADLYFKKLLTQVQWKHDEAIIFGKKIITRRKVAWYADQAFEYRYSNITKKALPWSKDLLQLKDWVEKKSNQTYNSCLLNLYHNGSEGMAWHSDGETDLKKHGAIASLSLGAERKFAFKHKKSGQKVELILRHGSLLIMTGVTQDHWLHRLPRTKKIADPRINLTYRSIHRK